MSFEEYVTMREGLLLPDRPSEKGCRGSTRSLPHQPIGVGYLQDRWGSQGPSPRPFPKWPRSCRRRPSRNYHRNGYEPSEVWLM